MTTTASERRRPPSWTRIPTGDVTVAIAQRAALGTSARLAVWPPEKLDAALAALDDVLGALDRQASRFRQDSELSWVHRSGGGLFILSEGLAEAVSVALAAAAWTRGMTDPTVGKALIALGYDRDFAAIPPGLDEPPPPPPPPPAPRPAPGWRAVQLDGPMLRLPAGVLLDLGATAKGLGADRSARAALAAAGNAGGVLVSLGGDIAVAGTPPRGGWPIVVADEPAPGNAHAQSVRLSHGAVATSSITCRQWQRAGRLLHHIVDPRTGLPAAGPWRAASVAAATCADANAAATAAVVAGDRAEAWLSTTRLPARLVSHDGAVRHVGNWPRADSGLLHPPPGSHVYARVRPGGLR